MASFGGIEAGGTKTVCAIGSGPDDLRARMRIPTTTPDKTLGETVRFFRERQQEEPLTAIGIASFGPVDPNPNSPTFGTITTTPKPGWAHTDLAGTVRRELGLPVGFDTDVNAAAPAELLTAQIEVVRHRETPCETGPAAETGNRENNRHPEEGKNDNENQGNKNAQICFH